MINDIFRSDNQARALDSIEVRANESEAKVKTEDDPHGATEVHHHYQSPPQHTSNLLYTQSSVSNDKMRGAFMPRRDDSARHTRPDPSLKSRSTKRSGAVNFSKRNKSQCGGSRRTAIRLDDTPEPGQVPEAVPEDENLTESIGEDDVEYDEAESDRGQSPDTQSKISDDSLVDDDLVHDVLADERPIAKRRRHRSGKFKSYKTYFPPPADGVPGFWNGKFIHGNEDSADGVNEENASSEDGEFFDEELEESAAAEDIRCVEVNADGFTANPADMGEPKITSEPASQTHPPLRRNRRRAQQNTAPSPRQATRARLRRVAVDNYTTSAVERSHDAGLHLRFESGLSRSFLEESSERTLFDRTLSDQQTSCRHSRSENLSSCDDAKRRRTSATSPDNLKTMLRASERPPQSLRARVDATAGQLRQARAILLPTNLHTDQTDVAGDTVATSTTVDSEILTPPISTTSVPTTHSKSTSLLGPQHASDFLTDDYPATSNTTALQLQQQLTDLTHQLAETFTEIAKLTRTLALERAEKTRLQSGYDEVRRALEETERRYKRMAQRCARLISEKSGLGSKGEEAVMCDKEGRGGNSLCFEDTVVAM